MKGLCAELSRIPYQEFLIFPSFMNTLLIFLKPKKLEIEEAHSAIIFSKIPRYNCCFVYLT